MTRRLAVYAVWTAAALLYSLAPIRAADARVRLVLSTTPLKEEPKRDRERRAEIWLLRPNIQQELLTYVKNDDPSQSATVTVQLLAGGPADVAGIDAGQIARVDGESVIVAARCAYFTASGNFSSARYTCTSFASGAVTAKSCRPLEFSVIWR